MTELHDPARADLQLAVIARLARALDDHGIDYWLFGGWAVDFWVGSVTRDHDDMDVAVRWSDRVSIGGVLLAGGWQHRPAVDHRVGTRLRCGATEVEFTFVVTSPNGGTFIPFDEPVRWSADPFGADRRTLKGVVARVIPLPILMAGKRSFTQGVGREPSDKDRAFESVKLRERVGQLR